MDNAAGFEIKAGVKEPAFDSWTEVTLQVEVKVEVVLIVISHNGREIARLPLTLPIDDAADFAAANIDIDRDADIIEDAIGVIAIEEFVHLIPTDPIWAVGPLVCSRQR